MPNGQKEVQTSNGVIAGCDDFSMVRIFPSPGFQDSVLTNKDSGRCSQFRELGFWILRLGLGCFFDVMLILRSRPKTRKQVSTSSKLDFDHAGVKKHLHGNFLIRFEKVFSFAKAMFVRLKLANFHSEA